MRHILGHELPSDNLGDRGDPPAMTAMAAIGGLLLGVVAVGWPFRTGAMLNLDLVVFDDIPVPESAWALGPVPARRTPLLTIAAVFSLGMSGVTIVRLWMIGIVALATTGMFRYLRAESLPVRVGAAMLFGWSPYLLTRLGVGHLGLATAAALLPWAAPALLDPLRSLRRTLLWLFAFALCGFFGGLLGGTVLLVGLVSSRRWPGATPLAMMILSQTPWLATALLTLDATGSAAGSSAFPTDLDAPGDLAPIVLGFGFWQPANQIGVGGVAAFAVAAFLVATAAVGVRWSTGADRWPLVALGLVGLVIAVASGLPDIDRAFERLTELAPFTAVREGQRMAALLVFVVTVFAARGLTMATRENRAAAVGAGVALGGSAILLVGGSLWGLDGRIDPVPLPESWNRASRIVERAPGPTLALPWNQFFDLDVADGRRTHHPVPFLIDVDVIAPHDLQLDSGGQESRDPREPAVPALLDRLLDGGDVSVDLDRLGLRWIVVLPDRGRDIEAALALQPGLRRVIDEADLTLFEVTSWSGPVVGSDATTAAIEPLLPGVWRVSDGSDGRWLRLAEPGWLQGWGQSTERFLDGVELPGGNRVVWNWRSAVVLALDLYWVGFGLSLLALSATRAKRPSIRASELVNG